LCLASEGVSETRKTVAIQGVPNPLAPSIAVDQAGVTEDFKVVGDGSLSLADRSDEVAYADLTLGGGGEHGYEADADRVAEGAEASSQLRSLGDIEWRREQRGAAFARSGRLQDGFGAGHGNLLLTNVDASAIINVLNLVDVIRRLFGVPCSTCPECF
jgi:hypothetical protein